MTLDIGDLVGTALAVPILYLLQCAVRAFRARKPIDEARVSAIEARLNSAHGLAILLDDARKGCDKRLLELESRVLAMGAEKIPARLAELEKCVDGSVKAVDRRVEHAAAQEGRIVAIEDRIARIESGLRGAVERPVAEIPQGWTVSRTWTPRKMDAAKE